MSWSNFYVTLLICMGNSYKLIILENSAKEKDFSSFHLLLLHSWIFLPQHHLHPHQLAPFLHLMILTMTSSHLFLPLLLLFLLPLPLYQPFHPLLLQCHLPSLTDFLLLLRHTREEMDLMVPLLQHPPLPPVLSTILFFRLFLLPLQ